MLYILNGMKIKKWFMDMLAGIAMGISSCVPGVSAATMIVIFKVYDKVVWAVSHILKEFKRAFIILLPIGIGLLIGAIPTIILVHKTLNGFLFGLVCIFAGFIIGSIPQITDEIKDSKPKKIDYVIIAITFVIALGLGVLSIITKLDATQMIIDHPVYAYFIIILIGLVASAGLIVPGISGGLILILVGFYSPLINVTVDIFKNAFNGDWSAFGPHIGLLLCFLIGVVIGFFSLSKVMNRLLNKFRVNTFYGILGFILGSVPALFLNYQIWEYYQIWVNGGQGYLSRNIEIIIGAILLLVAISLSYLLTRIAKKGKPKIENKEQIEE